MIKEAANSLQKSILERFTNPLAGAFILSWSIWNWRLLATLFLGREDIAARIETVITKYYDHEHLLYSPALSTVGIIVLYPLLSLGAFRVWELWTPLKRRIACDIDDKTPLTRDEARALKHSLQEEKDKMLDQLDKKEKENIELKKDINALDIENKKIITEKNELSQKVIGLEGTNRLSVKGGKNDKGNIVPENTNNNDNKNIVDKDDQAHIDILISLSKFKNGLAPLDLIMNEMHLSEQKTKYYLDQLASRGLIDITGINIFCINAKGRDLLHKLGLLE